MFREIAAFLQGLEYYVDGELVRLLPEEPVVEHLHVPDPTMPPGTFRVYHIDARTQECLSLPPWRGEGDWREYALIRVDVDESLRRYWPSA